MPPSILFSLTLATCLGCGFHVVVGRRLWQWPLFWLVAVLGFFLGYVAGVASGFELARIGSVPIVASLAGALAALLLAWYFTHPYARERA
jgi:ribose/xylose/arabinose/galactoside ABC-type transport system permease subunit